MLKCVKTNLDELNCKVGFSQILEAKFLSSVCETTCNLSDRQNEKNFPKGPHFIMYVFLIINIFVAYCFLKQCSYPRVLNIHINKLYLRDKKIFSITLTFSPLFFFPFRFSPSSSIISFSLFFFCCHTRLELYPSQLLISSICASY